MVTNRSALVFLSVEGVKHLILDCVSGKRALLRQGISASEEVNGICSPQAELAPRPDRVWDQARDSADAFRHNLCDLCQYYEGFAIALRCCENGSLRVLRMVISLCQNTPVYQTHITPGVQELFAKRFWVPPARRRRKLRYYPNETTRENLLITPQWDGNRVCPGPWRPAGRGQRPL